MSAKLALLKNNKSKSLAYQTSLSVNRAKIISGRTEIIRLSSNENAYGPSPRALSCLNNTKEFLQRYPDDTYEALKEKLSKNLSVSPSKLVLGNGSSEIIQFIVNAFLTPDDQVLMSKHAFSLYRVLSEKAQAEVKLLLDKDWKNNLEDFVQAIGEKTKLIFIANPNNPTGTMLSSKELKSFLMKVPEHITVVIDEAYAEFITHPDYQSMVPQLAQYKNLIVLRTFSKAYGLAGLRLGYAIANEAIIEKLNLHRNPFNVNTVAAEVAAVALEDQLHIQATVEKNCIELMKFKQFLSLHNLSYIDSLTNFICIRLFEKTELVYQQLLKKGILTRTLREYDMADFLRISIGTKEEMDECKKALLTILKGFAL
jgi:histidinol-phosphate aminotransferase